MEVAELVDLFLYDIKHLDPIQHKKLTGVDNALILYNLSWLLENNCNTIVRIPLLNGINKQAEHLKAIASHLLTYKKYQNFLGAELLPYHKLGASKYKQLDMPYEYATLQPDIHDDSLAEAQIIFKEYGIKVTSIKH